MEGLDNIIDSIAERKINSARRRKLLELLDKINSGQIDSRQVPIDELYSLWDTEKTQITRKHISPQDRSSYNYGYMEADEMQAGNPNIW